MLGLPSRKLHKLGGRGSREKSSKRVCLWKKNVFKWIHLSGRFRFFRSKQQALLAHRRCFTGEKSRWIHASENPANDSVYKPEEAWNPGDVTPSREIWQHKPFWREEGSALGIIAAWLQRNGVEPVWEIISFDID